MSSVGRLRHAFTANLSSITAAATTAAVKPLTTSKTKTEPKKEPKPETKTETKPKPKPKPKPKRKPLVSLRTVAADFETPEGIRNVVDDFKKACSSSRFRHHGASVYTDTVRNLAKAGAFPMIEEIIEDQKQYPDMSTEGFVVRLITLYSKAGMLDHARKLFDEMPSFNCSCTNKSLSALLNACVLARRYDAVVELFRELTAKYSIRPDVVVYNVVVHALCKMDSLDSALGLLDEMEELGLEPTLVTFNTLASAFYEKRGFDEGEKIWTLMKARNVEPDVLSYRFRMIGMVADGRIGEAVELFGVMRESGIKPDVYCFNVLIREFCDDGNLEDAKHWYDELVRCECSPVRYTYVTLVPFLAEMGDCDLAFRLCKEALGGGMVLIDLKTLERVVERFVSNGMVEEATELVRLAREKKLGVGIICP